jgi:hypothetical protein
MIFTRHLDSRGNGLGVKNANGLYADSTVTFTNSTNLVNLSSHGFADGDGPFTLSSTTFLPAEILVDGGPWYIKAPGADSFYLSKTRGGDIFAFTDDGTGTHTIHTPFQFYLEPAAGETFFVTRLLVSLRDSAVNADDYGAIAGGLTNGITVKVYQGNTETADLTDGVPIQTSADWARICYDSSIYTWGVGDVFLGARWTFEKHGQPIRLDGDQSERLVVVCNDDLNGLTNQYFVAQGYTK